ncbi:polysaccharide deacetylase family protein [Rhizomicrobium electricum]|uniref:Chitooligosaccharide deacetylase n=1 Tax=Rhizomicrobium electricum TaxID=480070 RepID=A0ABN1E398_9PROT|nr:polysaccharide deacetylase family protein [Rhizomicrobium electricum]NIJ47558.1 peptidoglycan/xylan/chitin deacetylase (PgdA/CDA1 family) [Rhizomicrobium electricum]
MSVCLMLHGIGPAPERVELDERPYWISEAAFACVLAETKAHGACLTFDDGNDTDARIVLPKLVEAGLTAAFFIPSDRIGTPGYVTEHDILELHQAGMEIGSHGCAHLNWLHAGDAEIANDVTRSIERLAGIIKAPVRSVAIPYGHCDRRVLAVLRRLGIGRVYSSFRGPSIEGAWLVRRDCITADMGTREISALMIRKPDAAEAALTFLRIWRRAGNAAIWAA